MFGQKLRDAREDAALSQQQAAERAGMAQSLWCQYERGNIQPSLQQAVRLAEAVGATLVKLLGRGDN